MPKSFLWSVCIASVLCTTAVHSASTQTAAQVNGTIDLRVDATDFAHKLLTAHETIPVTPGTLSLSFAQWLPGTHSAEGKIDRLTGLVMRVDGKVVAWNREETEPFRFTVEIPAGTSRLEIDLTYVTPVDRDRGRVFVDRDISEVEWQDVILYPSGINSSDVLVRARLQFPESYQFACALETEQVQGSTVAFKETTLETLIDSPLISGRYFKRYSLAADQQVPVYLDVVADRPEELEATPDALAQHRMLIRQAALLFGTTHYAHYDFLLSISDQIGGIGLEHHQSSEDGTEEGYFTQYSSHWDARGLLPHEYVHSWNGKYRRPSDLATPNYNVPMGGSLLWVYEGQTDYWGNVLSNRAGMENPEQAHEYFAQAGASVDRRPGRIWRDLEDTTRSGAMGGDSSDWRSWQRYAGDYYREMDFVWMQVDAMIRRDSNNVKSLDAFAKRFFGQEPGQRKVTTYTFEDIISALHAVDPAQDWSAFLRQRLDSHSGHPAEEALRSAGWRIEFTDQENLFTTAREHHPRSGDSVNLIDSIGLNFGPDGKITEVEWSGAGFKAGAVVGLQVIAVDGEAFSKQEMLRALRAAKQDTAPIVLLVKDGYSYRSLNVDYHDGPRWPHLVRISGSTDYLSDILAPRQQ
jgi:predicted metalloprotease with PDZ domain